MNLILAVYVVTGFVAYPVQEPKENPKIAIRRVLDQQVAAWNRGDINKFMEGYWKSDSILFIGSEIATGWESTLARYKRSYPDKAAMGILKFEILRIDFISSDSYLVTGKYFLTRAKDSPSVFLPFSLN